MACKDAKTKEISLKDFFIKNNNLKNVTEDVIFDNVEKPKEYGTYFKFSGKYFVKIHYSSKLVFPSLTWKPILEYVEFAKRDGKTEYDLVNDALKKLRKRKLKGASEIVSQRIKNLENILCTIPEYNSGSKQKTISFEDCLVETGKKYDVGNYKKKIIIFDTETNGTRTKQDDLLSLSIYDPSIGICYNRLLPLDLQPLVLTSAINGIKESDLEGQPHLNQEEVDKIIEYFGLDNAFILSYSGGKGKFDSSFLINYCERHKLHGFENLDYQNIKSCIPQAPFGSEGQLTKDNLCRIFRIEGVSDLHSSMNDCILEYQLFDKLIHGNIFFIGKHIFAYHHEYIIPVSYLNKYKQLAKYAKIELKPIVGEVDEIYSYKFPRQIANQIIQFPTNITGITFEHSLNNLLKVEKQNNVDFLANNKSHLEYVGSLDSRIVEIPIIEEDNGLISTTDTEHAKFVDEVNNVSKIIMTQLDDVIGFIKETIFKEKSILSQELVVSDDNKVLAICDLSDKNNVVEVKTYDVIDEDGNLLPDITRQLFYQSKGRNAYVLSFKIADVSDGNRGVTIKIYKVTFQEVENLAKTIVRKFSENDIKIANVMEKHPNITLHEAAFVIKKSEAYARQIIMKLLYVGVIERIGPANKHQYKVLRHIDKSSTFEIKRNS